MSFFAIFCIGGIRKAMFINKAINGNNNICGNNVASLRKALGLSQQKLAMRLQIKGLDVDKNAIQRIEAGKRFVTDIELIYLADALGATYSELLNHAEINTTPIVDKKNHHMK